MKLVEPPVALRFHPIDFPQLQAAKQGICPHCPRPVFVAPGEVHQSHRTLEEKYRCQAIRFLQCRRCLVVVALEV